MKLAGNSLAPIGDLIRFWRSKVMVTAAGLRGVEDIYVDAKASKSIS